MKTLFLMVSCLAILASCNNIERLDSNENDLSRIVQSAIEQYETDYASKYLRVKKENTVLLGCNYSAIYTVHINLSNLK